MRSDAFNTSETNHVLRRHLLRDLDSKTLLLLGLWEKLVRYTSLMQQEKSDYVKTLLLTAGNLIQQKYSFIPSVQFFLKILTPFYLDPLLIHMKH